MMDFIMWLDWPAIWCGFAMLCGMFMGMAFERAKNINRKRPSNKVMKKIDDGIGLLSEYFIK